jgi:hypothetical protein
MLTRYIHIPMWLVLAITLWHLLMLGGFVLGYHSARKQIRADYIMSDDLRRLRDMQKEVYFTQDGGLYYRGVTVERNGGEDSWVVMRNGE